MPTRLLLPFDIPLPERPLEWSAQTLREFHRHPEAHPRRAVEFGRLLGGVLAAHHCDDGVMPTEYLEEQYGDLMATLPEVEPWLEVVLPEWQSIFMLWVIRSHFAERYGAAALGGFDAGADDIHKLFHPELHEDALPGDPTPRKLTDWFRAADLTLARIRESEWLADCPAVERPQAFSIVALTSAPESPMCGEFDAPEREAWNEQLGVNVGWLEPFAVGLGRIRTKELVRQLAKDGRSGDDVASHDGERA